MFGSGPDLREGERIQQWSGLGADLEVYRQPNGEIAIWDGARHVIVPSNRADWKVAVQMLRAAAARAAHV